MKAQVSRWVLGFAFSGFITLPVHAHFQEIIPSQDVLDEGGSVTVDLVFTHPFEGGPVMNMERPAEIGVFANGERTDLSDLLVEKKVDGETAWSFDYELIEPGVSIFYVTPEPYWEAAENIYVLHHAKVIVDNYASGEGWDEMVGLPVEIQPLTRPTGIWTGNLFSGVVTKDGEPMPFTELEIAYVNEQGLKAPNDAYPLQTITADANGTFHYAIPFDGWWGFTALLEGDEPMLSPDGEEVAVEEGATIWVHTASPGE